jgi:predicted AAA+ superfamily ATPase
LYVIGSNAYLLSGELATLLTGRYIETNVLPLQFSEYYHFMISKPPNLQNSETLAVSGIYNIDYKQITYSKPPNLSKMELLAGYLQEGGIPEYHKQKNISQRQADDFVQSVLNTIIEKDIFQRLTKDKHNFNKIIDFVFDSVGSYVSPRSISDTLRHSRQVKAIPNGEATFGHEK